MKPLIRDRSTLITSHLKRTRTLDVWGGNSTHSDYESTSSQLCADVANGFASETYGERNSALPYERVCRKITRKGGQMASRTVRTVSNPSWAIGRAYLATVSYENPLGLQSHAEPDWSAFTKDVQDARSRAEVRYYNRLADAITSFSSGVFLGEIRELRSAAMTTLQGFLSLRRSFYNAVAEILKRPNRSRAERKFLASQWLNYQYAVRPLYADLEAFNEGIERLNSERKYVKVRATEEIPSHVTLSSDTGGGYQELSWYTRTRIKTEGIVRCSGFVSTHPEVPKVMQQGRIFGLDPRQALPVVWELTPWSFLADYFLPLGQWITAASYETVTQYYACTSEMLRESVTVNRQPISPPRSFYVLRASPPPQIWQLTTTSTEGGDEIKDEWIRFKRTPGVTCPGLLQFLSTRWRFPSTIQWANILALFLAR